jgi:hypothetical protein
MLWRAGGGPLGRRRQRPPANPATEDEVQIEVLALVLREHPALLSFPLLAEWLFEERGDFEAGYSLARAVRELNVVGVLHSNGLFVMPSRALMHLAHLGVVG